MLIVVLRFDLSTEEPPRVSLILYCYEHTGYCFMTIINSSEYQVPGRRICQVARRNAFGVMFLVMLILSSSCLGARKTLRFCSTPSYGNAGWLFWIFTEPKDASKINFHWSVGPTKKPERPEGGCVMSGKRERERELAIFDEK